MALTTMGLVNSIIGLGGRETAARQLEQWQARIKDVDQKLVAQAPAQPSELDELSEPPAPDQPKG